MCAADFRKFVDIRAAVRDDQPKIKFIFELLLSLPRFIVYSTLDKAR